MRCRSPIAASVALAWMMALSSPPASAANVGAEILPRSIELGVVGAVSVIERNAVANLAVRCGTFAKASSGRIGAEVEVAYGHVTALDALEVGALVTWQRAWTPGIYPYFGIGAAIREDWIGSFREARIPAGFDLGVRSLAGPRAEVRAEYRFRRVMHDPVASFTEQQLRIGISLLLRNTQH